MSDRQTIELLLFTLDHYKLIHIYDPHGILMCCLIVTINVSVIILDFGEVYY